MFVLKAGLPKGQLVHIVLTFCGARLPISVLLGSLTGGSFLMINTVMGGEMPPSLSNGLLEWSFLDNVNRNQRKQARLNFNL